MGSHRIVWVVLVLAWAGSLGFGAPRRSFDAASMPEGGDAWAMAGHAGVIIIEGVRVNGTGPYRFLLDTGTTGGVRLDARVASALGIEPRGSTRTGARRPGSGPTLDTIELEALEVGGCRWEGVYGAVRTLSSERTAPEHRIDGVLAWHLFADWTVALDLGAREVRVREEELPRPGREGVAYMRGDRDGPTMPLRAGSVKINALLDTGNAAGVLISTRFRARLPIEGEMVEAGFVGTIDGTSPAFTAALSEPITLAGVAIEQDRVWLTDGIYPANVGLEAIAGGVVEIDVPNHRIRFTPAAKSEGPAGDSPPGADESDSDASGPVARPSEGAGVDAADGMDDDDEHAPPGAAQPS